MSLTDFHELEKDLYIAAGSSQVDGEYGFAFNVTATFANGTVTTGPLVDVFATDIGPNGGFATFADPFAVQDPATLAIYNAAVPEPSALYARRSALRRSAFGVSRSGVAAFRNSELWQHENLNVQSVICIGRNRGGSELPLGPTDSDCRSSTIREAIRS